jgi:hypothetical protein
MHKSSLSIIQYCKNQNVTVTYRSAPRPPGARHTNTNYQHPPEETGTGIQPVHHTIIVVVHQESIGPEKIK